MPAARGQDLIRNIGLFSASLILCGILAEGVARLFFPEWAPRTARVAKFWQFDEDLGWSHIPNSSGPFSSFGIETHVTINQAGFRGPLIPFK